MRLIVGGYAQGKTAYARSSYPEAEIYEIDTLLAGRGDIDKAVIITGLNDWVRLSLSEWLSKKQADSQEMEVKADMCLLEQELKRQLRELLARVPEAVIITEENGNGLVPMDRSERDYRDLVGRIQIELAGEAERVERVICGIVTIIK